MNAKFWLVIIIMFTYKISSFVKSTGLFIYAVKLRCISSASVGIVPLTDVVINRTESSSANL